MRTGGNQIATKRVMLGVLIAFSLIGRPQAWAGTAGTLEVNLPPRQLAQGDLRSLRVTAPEPLSSLHARFRGLDLPARPGGREYTVLLAVDLETPPDSYLIEFEGQGASGNSYRRRVQVMVTDGRFPLQRLTLPKGMVELDAKTLERVRREQSVMAAIWEKWQAGPYWWQAFVPPLNGARDVTSEFGLRRILNGHPRSPHSGVDFRASQGTPVQASNGGVVVYTGEMFFNGNSVILHHGGGLFTTYFHLQEYRVDVGQEVAKGEVIGWVGATGRATGPHLHWGANLRGVRFDPRRLLELSLP